MPAQAIIAALSVQSRPGGASSATLWRAASAARRLVVAASSFVYIAVADLMPQLQRRLRLRETLAQLGWIGAGLASVVVIGGLTRA